MAPENVQVHSDERLFWPWASGVKEAYETLILRSGIPTLAGSSLAGDPSQTDPLRAIQWIRRAPRSMGLDTIEETGISIDGLFERFLEVVGPLFVVLKLRNRFLVLAATFEKGAWVRVITKDGDKRMTRIALHEALVRASLQEAQSIDALFENLPGGAAVVRALKKSSAQLGDALLIRFETDSAHTLPSQLWTNGGWKALGLHTLLAVVQSGAALGAIWTLGDSLVDGRIDAGRVVGWALLAASEAPLQYVATRMLAHFTIGLGSSIKRRLLEGTFFINEKDVRTQGFGELIARTNEASVVEQLNLGELSGFALAVFEMAAAAFFLLHGEHKPLALAVLVVSLAATLLLVKVSVGAYREVFASRLRLTDDLVDKIIGHRTRAVQESPSQRHLEEDVVLSEYAVVGARLDRARTASSVAGRVWLLVGSTIVILGLVLGEQLSSLVFSGLGVLLGYRALVAFFPALERFVEWYTAWKGFDALLTAGRQRERLSRRLDFDITDGAFPTALSMSAVSFAYKASSAPVLDDIDLRVRVGDKVLIEGASGSGKTTLLKLIAGEQLASGGVILVGGNDRFSLSETDWRRRVASAPQFHENHVFANSLAFNLDPWGEPGLVSQEAQEICEELGLAPLIERMPQGFAQIIGETGWQLSHGERSRIFIARALLQKAEIFLFDENFGALDPETLIQALECVRRRAKTLLVIAHT